MNKAELINEIKLKRSYLCVGLDSDIDKIPKHLLAFSDPVFEFNKQIIEATKDFCVAYKPNLAFYESRGLAGWISLQKTLEIIPKNCFTIADAKRGDIGNTSTLYAKAFFEAMNFDSVTIAPYMGKDSVEPFLKFDGKWAILLGVTSNEGANDFQLSKLEDGKSVYEEVILKAASWATSEQLMFVVGATRPEQMKHVRALAPDYFFLVPGVGAQGGDLTAISRAGMNANCGLLVNSSRQIIFASASEDFAEKAGMEAKKVQMEMDVLLREIGV
jgi:orotidine-5'-phosphate decarboxylase